MGTTFSNIHIYKNNCVTGKDVSEFLFELMKQKGFVESKQENADISFSVLSFPDSDWITVCDNYNVFEDMTEQKFIASSFSEKFGSKSLCISCFDSDYVCLNLLDSKNQTDIWASSGSCSGLGIKRRSAISKWKPFVKDFNSFNSSFKTKNIFAEDILSEIENNIGFIPYQSRCEFDFIDIFSSKPDIIKLHFTFPESSAIELPELSMLSADCGPIISGKPNCVSCYNTGGASKGIEIIFFGKCFENDKLTFKDVEYIKEKNDDSVDYIPITLSKIELRIGSEIINGYYSKLEDYRISPKIPDNLPSAVRCKRRYKESITIRFVIESNSEKIEDFNIAIRPLKNKKGVFVWNFPKPEAS